MASQALSLLQVMSCTKSVLAPRDGEPVRTGRDVPDADTLRTKGRQQLPVVAQVQHPVLGVLAARQPWDRGQALPGLDADDGQGAVVVAHDQAAAVGREVGGVAQPRSPTPHRP